MTERADRFEEALRLLPAPLRESVRAVSENIKDTAEELRLRAGAPPSAVLPEGEVFLTGCGAVTKRDLEGVLDIATGASVHSSRDSICAGYVTVRGGFRIGIAGSLVTQAGKISGFHTVSSLSVRIPREVRGVSDAVIRRIAPEGKACSALIVSPPGAGKTTLLRDIVRTFSDGDERFGIPGCRVGLADERGEVASLCGGVPQMYVGRRTDVLEGCPKASAVMMLMRSMNPQIIALDEITAPEDIEAIESAANCGVKLLATAHAEDMDDLRCRRMYLRLLDGGMFKFAVFITRVGAGREYTVRKLGDRR